MSRSQPDQEVLRTRLHPFAAVIPWTQAFAIVSFVVTLTAVGGFLIAGGAAAWYAQRRLTWVARIVKALDFVNPHKDVPLNLAAYYFGAAYVVGEAWVELIVPTIIYVAIYRAVLKTADYLRTTLTITDRHIIKETGVFEIESQALPLESLTDSTIRRTIPGRFFGYGHVLADTAGTDAVFFNLRFVAAPRAFWATVQETIREGAA